MAKFGGFWSYAHEDDDTEFGRIVDLGRDLVSQYKMLTGEPIELFLDRDSLEWGQAWKQRVDESLASVAFFVPVMTPTYFKRPECRRELRFFAEKARALGLQELVMPVLWVDFPALHEAEPSDDLIAMVKTFQWVIWTELRFTERGSAEYRKAVSEMAQRLVDANAAAAISPPEPPFDESGDGGGEKAGLIEDDELGLVDRIAIAESAVPEWTAIVERIGNLVEELGAEMQAGMGGIEKSDSKGGGFAGRVNLFRHMASNLAEPADEMIRLGNDFASRLSEVDSGYRAIVETVRAGVDPEDEAEVQDFYDTVRGLAESTRESMESLEGLLGQFGQIERMSRDLRSPLKKFRTGLTTLLEGRAVIDEWVHLLDENPIRVVEPGDNDTPPPNAPRGLGPNGSALGIN